MNADKEKHGAPGRDKDSIRAAILDEAVIVCNICLVLEAKKGFVVSFLISVCLTGLLHP